MRLRGRDAYIVPSASTDGFRCASDRNMQSVIDNLRSPKTIEQLCEKTVLTTGEVRLCLRELEEEGSLVVDGDHYLVL